MRSLRRSPRRTVSPIAAQFLASGAPPPRTALLRLGTEISTVTLNDAGNGPGRQSGRRHVTELLPFVQFQLPSCCTPPTIVPTTGWSVTVTLLAGPVPLLKTSTLKTHCQTDVTPSLLTSVHSFGGDFTIFSFGSPGRVWSGGLTTQETLFDVLPSRRGSTTAQLS